MIITSFHRHREACEAVLALTGFNLLHDDYHRIFQAVSNLVTAVPVTSWMSP